MEPTNPVWNSPNLSATGNWYTDSVVVANDGTEGSACGTLFSLHQGNFAIFYRTNCLIGEQLLNLQNAGATGALVIDSVTGRPLPFGSDSLSSQVNIPFVIISEDEGDAIINAINSGDTVVVNMGNKQGQNSIDLGMRMDRAMWSSFAYYPPINGIFPESDFGVWVYNYGQQDVQNIQVEFWIDESQFSYSDVSDSIDLLQGDSIYIPFYITTTPPGFYSQMDYGYQIHNVSGDTDTLDNRLVWKMYNSELNGGFISRTFVNTNSLQNTECDFLYDSGVTTESSIGFSCNTEDIICWTYAYVGMYAEAGDEIFVNLMELDDFSSPYSPTQGTLSQFGFEYPSQSGVQFLPFILQYSLDLHIKDTSGVYVQYFNSYGLNFQLAFTTDMYHDERRRREPFHDVHIYIDGIDSIALDPKLTELIFVEASTSPSTCGWGFEEFTADAVQLAPNPATSSFQIVSEMDVESVRMISISGREVPLSNTVDAYLFDAVPGMYMVEITNGQSVLISKKLLVE
ncbi:MAG: hypothetical protein Crog4KO_21130 [Crocinitomicaceae bacterium]